MHNLYILHAVELSRVLCVRRRQTALDACWGLPRMLPNGVARSELVVALKEAGVPSYQGEDASSQC